MSKNNYDKTADNLAKRFKDYECDGQMSIFDVDWTSLNDKNTEIEENDYEPCI